MNTLKLVSLWILITVTFTLTLTALFSISNTRLATTEPFDLKLDKDHYFVPVNPFCYFCRDYSIQLSRDRDIEEQLRSLTENTCFRPWTKFKGNYYEFSGKAKHPNSMSDEGSIKIVDYEGYRTSCCTLDRKLMRTRLIDLELNIGNMRLDGYYRGFDRSCSVGWFNSETFDTPPPRD